MQNTSKEEKRRISVAVKIISLSSLLLIAAVTIMTVLGIYYHDNLQIKIIAAACLLAVSLTVNIIAFRSWLINPVKKIIGALYRVEEGNISRQLHLPKGDEMGDIALHIDKTMDNFKHLVLIIQNQAEAVDGIGIDLASNMDRTAVAMDEINGSVQKIQKQIINQSNSINATNDAIGLITGNIDKLSEGIEIQSINVTQSSSAIEEMLANIESVAKISRTNSENVAKLNDASEAGRKSLQSGK